MAAGNESAHLEVGAEVEAEIQPDAGKYTELVRAEVRMRGVAARRAAIKAGARFRRDFADAKHWAALAKARGIKLPRWHTAPTPGRLKFWHQTLVNSRFEAVYGHTLSGPMTPALLIERNPDWPLRAFVGVMLEMAG
jgi:hypothetical protein